MKRKDINELSLEDIQSILIWGYKTENGTEWVMPTDLTELPSEEYCDAHNLIYVVLTEFVLSDGTKYLGFSSPVDPSGLDYVQPVMITDIGQVKIYLGEEENPKELRENYIKLLNRPLDKIFPIHMRSLVPMEGVYYEEMVDDFCGY